ncbi:FCP1-like phosphatase domain-containing [Tubulinosema ratisbonensis]|uniref:protein-serine/threonine phosphatase n=1 Tax=Tubulinosema ratisbonensis TaxID=291195 RepID=A0A437AMF4_9MICR|nr:FCP1-like phosphatase domain-containing [Tubulinosema ratisbonensis]
MKECKHEITLKNICCLCGSETFTKNKQFCHLTTTEIIKSTTYQHKHLTLILDLDETIVNTTSISLFNIPINKLQEITYISSLNNLSTKEINLNNQSIIFDLIFKFNNFIYFIKLRKNAIKFLKKINFFKLYIFSMGTKEYVEIIKKYLNNQGINVCGSISREENMSFSKSVSRLGLSERRVVILDDRLDVWDYLDCVILVKPFLFYKNVKSVCEKSYEVNKKIKLEDMGVERKGVYLNKNVFVESESFLDEQTNCQNKNLTDCQHKNLTDKETNLTDKELNLTDCQNRNLTKEESNFTNKVFKNNNRNPEEASLTCIKLQNEKFFNEFLEKLKTFKIPSIFYTDCMNEINLKYNYYMENKIVSRDEWRKRAYQEIKCNFLYYPGYVDTELVKENIKSIFGNEIEKNYLCFQKTINFENISLAKKECIQNLLIANEKFIYYFVALLQVIDLNDYSVYTKENIKNLLCFNWSIFPESILPEFYFLKNVLANKIDQSNINVAKIYFMVRFFIHKSLSAFKKIIVLFSLHNFNPSLSYKAFYVSLYTIEMIQLRALLIYICNELGLSEISKILYFFTNFHLRYLSIDTPSDLEKRQFWIMYGNLLTCSEFVSFKQWHYKLKNDLVVHSNFDSGLNTPVNPANHTLPQNLSHLKDLHLHAYSKGNQNSLISTNFLNQNTKFSEMISDIKIIINLRIQLCGFLRKKFFFEEKK